jgi:serine/threonine-protein kinase HipA
MKTIEQYYAQMKLTIEIFIDSTWQKAATLEIYEPQKGRLSPCKLEYVQEYAMAHLFSKAEHACSLNLPVELMLPYRSNHWFGFMDDIVPSGASRRYWVEYLSVGNLPPGEQESALLANGCIAPVGNLRIRESVPEKRDESVHRRFSISDVINRQHDFLDYALEIGAISGGATGAAGEAPKVLVRMSERNQVWIDTWQDEDTNTDQHYLVKFPRGKKTQIDCDLLRAEHHYYCELAALGFNTVEVSKLKLIEGERYPSLWLPRFDVRCSEGVTQHFGLESIYSVLSVAPGSHLNHFEVIGKVSKLLEHDDPTFSTQAFVEEWLQRDLLNIIFANSDNHGRNTSLLKREGKVTLAPIYDFAPMKADPDGIVRTTRWGSDCERGGEFNWHTIINNLPHEIDKARCLHSLQLAAKKLVGLKDRLIERGVSSDLLSTPALGMNTINERLSRWGLL